MEIDVRNKSQLPVRGVDGAALVHRLKNEIT